MSDEPPIQDELLDRAHRLLVDEGFEVRTESLAGTDKTWLLAEDELFVIAVVTTEVVRDMRRVESFAVDALLQRLQSSGAGPKAWDAYLVLMTSRLAHDDDAADLLAMQQNTHGVRRLTAVGTEDSDLGVRTALRPFLPLPFASAGAVSDAFDELTTQLTVHGVPADLAARAVDAFKNQGDLSGF